MHEIKNQIKYVFVKRAIDNKIRVIEKNKQLFISIKIPPNNCFVHGDFHQRNIMFSNENYYLFDFEKARYGISELDLVRTVFSICFKGKFGQRQFEYFKSFTKGYIDFAPKISTNTLAESIVYFFSNNLLDNCYYEKRLLNENTKTSKLLQIYKSQINTINYLDNSFKHFTDISINAVLNTL